MVVLRFILRRWREALGWANLPHASFYSLEGERQVVEHDANLGRD